MGEAVYGGGPWERKPFKGSVLVVLVAFSVFSVALSINEGYPLLERRRSKGVSQTQAPGDISAEPRT
jgi:hypothetical protein